MGYFAIAMDDTPSELVSTIKANLELYKQVNKNNDYNYLLDMIQGDLEKLENSYLNTDKKFDTKFNVEHFVKEATQVTLDDDVEDTKLCYSLEELSDPKIFQEALDTLNNLEVNVFTGEVKLKNKEKEENVYND